MECSVCKVLCQRNRSIIIFPTFYPFVSDFYDPHRPFLRSVTNWSIMVDFRNLKYCIVAECCKIDKKLLKPYLQGTAFHTTDISGELESCNSFWMYPPLWTSLLVAMNDKIEKTSISLLSNDQCVFVTMISMFSLISTISMISIIRIAL